MILKSIFHNYNYIDSIIEVNDKLYSKKFKPTLSHFNYVHCGVEVFNMSKRIMNKVFSCADDCNRKIYDQGTASIHLNYEDVDKIEINIKKNMGQS